MKIAIGADNAGFDLKEKIKTYLANNYRHQIIDFGTNCAQPVDYPDIAQQVASAIFDKRAERGILICGLGLGMAIAANKFPGIYATPCHDALSARKSRESNNAQILTMGSQIISYPTARNIVKIWLASEYLGKSDKKLKKIKHIEKIFYPATRKPSM